MNRVVHILVFMTLFALLFALAPSQATAAVRFSISSFEVDQWPYDLAVADINKDGRRDVLTCDAGSSTVNVLLGNGLGGFLPRATYSTPTEPHSLVIGDFNNDGSQDVAVVNFGTTLRLLLGNGTGTFNEWADFAAGHGFRMTAADFNNDGKLDVVVGDANGLSILLGDGVGGFGPASQFGADVQPHGVAAGDVNEDGKKDLVTASPYTYGAAVLLGDGMGGFGAKTDYPTGLGATAVAVGDLNRDGHQDLAVANQDACTVSVWRGDGTGGFVEGGAYYVGVPPGPTFDVHPGSVVIADLNGDRKQDIATANYLESSGSVTVLQGNGSGSFGTRFLFRVGYSPVALRVADFNRDGKSDLVTANSLIGHVVVLRNTSKPQLYGLSPTAGRPGTTVTLTGWGFGRTRGTSKVYFGAKAVTRYVSWSAGKVKVRVPVVAAGRKAVSVLTRDGRTNTKYFAVR
jgi:FG-GAP-like repeat/IPT/TIG domain